MVEKKSESSYTVILDPSASIHYLFKQYGSAAHLHNLRILRKISAHENRKICLSQMECWGRKIKYKVQKTYLKHEKNLGSVTELITQ